jgi:hypothetical protein
MTTRRAGLLVAGLILALICYYLPWYTHPSAGFTLHGFDLAEWSSIHPATRSSSPPMLTSFLLRLPQLILIVALALVANGCADARVRWVLRGTALLLALRFLPPSDFFTGAARDDPNFRQMMLLTGLSFGGIGAALLLTRFPLRVQGLLLVLLLAVGVFAGWWGLSRAGVLLDNFEIDVAIGPGAVGLTLVSVALAVITLWPAPSRCDASLHRGIK